MRAEASPTPLNQPFKVATYEFRLGRDFCRSFSRRLWHNNIVKAIGCRSRLAENAGDRGSDRRRCTSLSETPVHHNRRGWRHYFGGLWVSHFLADRHRISDRSCAVGCRRVHWHECVCARQCPHPASRSLPEGVDISLQSAAVTGLLVAGLALLGVSVYFHVLTAPLRYAEN